MDRRREFVVAQEPPSITEPITTPIALHPHCDGRRLLFDIVDDNRLVTCAISLMALEDLSERRCYRPADQLKSFAQVRLQIEAIALSRIKTKPHDSSDLLTIWSDDVDDLLPHPG